MSSVEEKLATQLDRFDDDIAAVEAEINDIFAPRSLDALSTEQDGDNKARPYAMGAYTLSSLLFAYLKSEGQETNFLMPELGRVKSIMDKLDNPPKNKVSKAKKPASKPAVVRSHIRFDDATKPKTKKPKH